MSWKNSKKVLSEGVIRREEKKKARVNLLNTSEAKGVAKKKWRREAKKMEQMRKSNSAFALHRFARISPQKARLVADEVRGLDVQHALNYLTFSNKKASEIIKKVLDSAIANAENNQGLDVDNLCVSQILVDNGPTLKRMMPRAKGRADRILKRSSHIKIEVTDTGRG